VGKVFTFSLFAALNPTLLAAVTVMLTLLSPKRLLSGYLGGALITSFTCGLVLVFVLNGSSTSSSAKHTVNPVLDVVFGALILLIAFVVGTGRDKRRRARSARKREEAKHKPLPRWKRQLSKGSARDTFLVGVLLSFPGASYIAGMELLSKQKIGTGETVLAVIGFNLVMLLLLELPLIGYATRPVWTAATVARFNTWLSRSGGRVALIGAVVLGLVMVGRGAINW
jgi:Sap, sulfolipid-1-addressing protein